MWRLESSQGRWHTRQFQFQVDLRRPDLGWSDVQVQGRSLSDRVFQIRLPGEGAEQSVIDSYVRQSDLVVTYAQSPDRSVRPQIVWRVIRDGETRVGVEAILSMQTSLLDSQPKAAIEFELNGAVLQVTPDASRPFEDSENVTEPCVLLQRPHGEQCSFVVAIHPSDFLSLEMRSINQTASDEAGQFTALLSLFPESLEKGVIRRGRVRGIYVPRDGDVECARMCVQEMLEASPPLTT